MSRRRAVTSSVSIKLQRLFIQAGKGISRLCPIESFLQVNRKGWMGEFNVDPSLRAEGKRLSVARAGGCHFIVACS